jgi:hypothetical protein
LNNFFLDIIVLFSPGCAEEGGEKEGSMGTPPGRVGEGHLKKRNIFFLAKKV